MRCPDWRQLTARRDEGLLEESTWLAAKRHQDECRSCADAASQADPLLAFRRLPEIEVAAAEVEAVRQAVSALRSARRVESPRRRALGWQAAAALLVLSLAGLSPAVHLDEGFVEPSAVLAAEAWPPVAELADPRAIPLVEELDRPRARVYQLREADLSVVMIVDETLDV